jgi:outer membrane protein TolC
MQIRDIIICLLLLVISDRAIGQFTLSDCVETVLNDHPVVKLSDLQVSKAESYLLKAKGNFDPKLEAGLNQKEYTDKNYFTLLSGGLKIPTSLGFDVAAGYEVNRGILLNPENNIPAGGLMYGGIELPLGRGLWTDERRTQRAQARVGLELGLQQKNELLNNLVFDVVQQYLSYSRDNQIFQLYENASKNALDRLNALRLQVSAGDRPSIDTVEAALQYQQVEGLRLMAKWSAESSQILLERTYLNRNQQNSDTLTAVPQKLDSIWNSTSPLLVMNREDLENSHPLLSQYSRKQKQVELEIRFLRDRYKPDLRLQFFPLFQATEFNPSLFPVWENNKLGVQFSMPLYFRKERAEVQLAKIKWMELESEREFKSNVIFGKYETQMLLWSNLNEQMKLVRSNLIQSQKLLDAELELWNNGESSLFLVNSREFANIQINVRYAELMYRNLMSYYSAHWHAGTLLNLF